MQTKNRNPRRYVHRRSRRACRALAAVTAAVLVIGVIGLVTVELHIAARNRAIAGTESAVKQLDANAYNLTLYVDQYHNLAEIGKRAEQLGMQQPEAGQLRRIQVASPESSSTFAMSGGTAENGNH